MLVRKKLFQMRQTHNRTLQEMADMIGVSKPYYWQIENEQRGLSYDLAVKIAAVFGKTPDDIFLQEELTKKKQKKEVKKKSDIRKNDK